MLRGVGNLANAKGALHILGPLGTTVSALLDFSLDRTPCGGPINRIVPNGPSIAGATRWPADPDATRTDDREAFGELIASLPNQVDDRLRKPSAQARAEPNQDDTRGWSSLDVHQTPEILVLGQQHAPPARAASITVRSSARGRISAIASTS